MKNKENSFQGLPLTLATTMNQSEVDFLVSKLRKSRNYLEYGSGFSTIEARKYVKEEIFSVESSIEYVHFMKSKLAEDNVKSEKITFLHSQVGITGNWGYPVNKSAIEDWPKYGNLDNELFNLDKFVPDLVLIDGRFRIATFARLYITFPGLNIIFDDYNDRPQYQVVESFVEPRCKVGRIAFFKIPRIRRRQKIKLATDVMLRNILNPE